MKLKKRLAVLLTASMIMTMTVPAMASVSTNIVPDSRSATGVGDIVPHLDKEVAELVLPTISSDAFDFTVDPERLVEATNGQAFIDNGDKLKSGAMSNGVFFLVSENSYDSKTPEFDFENKSTFPIDLTVQVVAHHKVEATDLALLSANEVTVNPAPEAGLYLGLKVGGDDLSGVTGKEIKYGTPTKANVSINGVASNYTVSWNSTEKKYYNKVVDSPSAWSHGKFQIEGIATRGKDIEQNASAPTIEVTWSWKKYGEASPLNAVSISGTTIYAKVLASGTVDSKITSVKVNDVSKEFTTSSGVITIADAAPSAGKYKIEVVYDGETYKGEATK